jgi:hypothetical protein
MNNAREWDACSVNTSSRGERPALTRLWSAAVVVSVLALAQDAGPSLADNGILSDLTDISFRVSELRPGIQWSGRINSIALNPRDSRLVIVASDSGGLFRSRDGGTRWEHLDGLPTLRNYDVAFWPSDPNLVIATAEPDYTVMTAAGGLRTITTSGGGVWISRDGGTNWTHPDAAVPRANANISDSKCPARNSAFGISFEPGTNKIFVATECGVSISPDDGTTWRHVDIAPGNPSKGKFYAIAALGGDRIIVGGSKGIWQSTDGGNSWQKETTGIGGVPDDVNAIPVNAIAAVPGSTTSAFAVNNTTQLYYSDTGGTSWQRITSAPVGSGACGGIAFVRAARAEKRSTLARRSGIDLYFGDKCAAHRLIAVRGLTTGLRFTGPWTTLVNQHPDVRDIGLRIGEMRLVAGLEGSSSTYSEATPVFLAGDGGLERSGDGGGVWNTIGSGATGINALQVMDVAGQRVGASRYDIYFGTQDNWLWASSDIGRTWPGSSNGGEGGGLQLERRVEREADARVTYFLCGPPCSTNISEALLRNPINWPDPKANIDLPVILGRGTYLQYAPPTPPTLSQSKLNLTEDFGASWRQIATISGERWGQLQVVGSSDAPVAYQAMRTGTTPDLFPIRKLIRLSSIFRKSGAHLSTPANGGFGGLGMMPTMWMWFPVFAVDPGNPDHLIAADARNGRMAQSMDGAETWDSAESVVAMAGLTRLVTHDGELAFVDKNADFTDYFTLVSAISFLPEYPNFILVGTRQGGLAFSRNGGRDWERVPGSELITNVASIHWRSANSAVIGTYGRGLWKIEIDIRSRLRLDPLCVEPQCFYSDLGPGPVVRHVPITAISDAGPLPFDEVFLVLAGKINGIGTDNEGLREVFVTPAATSVWLGNHVTPSSSQKVLVTESSSGSAGRGKSEELAGLDLSNLEKGEAAVGLGVRNGDVVGVVTASGELPFVSTSVDQHPIPHEGEENPTIFLTSKETMYGRPILRATGDDLVIYGEHFHPSTPIEVLIDGERQKVALKPGADGTFKVALRLRLTPGAHQVVVQQESKEQAVFADSSTFFVPPEDERDERKN